jgi:predicted outer membrane lipoprotein
MRESGTALAVAFGMVNPMTEKKTEAEPKRTRGLLIAGASLLLLFGVAFLKGRAK